MEIGQYLAAKQANVKSEAEVTLIKRQQDQGAAVVSTLIEGATNDRPKEPGKGELLDTVA
jgi:hypothetical protein